MKLMKLNQIISLYTNLFDDKKIKLVRHKDNRVEFRELIKDREELIKYQRHQAKDIFKGCDYIFSFFGLDGSRSLFIGVFRIDGFVNKPEGGVHYDLTEIPGFEGLKDRLVIDWGKSALSWHQWASNEKEVLELMPKGYIGDFPGTMDFILDHDELRLLINNIDANKTWYHHLSSINGIYLILDRSTGLQYIGSAYGKEGIWQRWKDYSTSGHGGNKLLKNLCKGENGYYKNFQFSILQTLPSNITPKEVVRYESLYKKKLGTRSYGLNDN